MLDRGQAESFAKQWVEAWNSRDLERVLEHWAEDCSFASPLIAQLGVNPDGRLEGKAALRAYWARGLAANPELHFDFQRVLVGTSSIVIEYTNHRGQHCAEMLELDAAGRTALRGVAHYSSN